MGIGTIDEYVGNQLKLRRKSLKMSQRALAQKIGIALRQLQKYELGINKIGAGRLYHFATLLNTDISYFFEGFGSDNISYFNDNYEALDKEMIMELVPAFVLLPQDTKETFLKLIKDIAAEQISSKIKKNIIATEL